MIDRLKVGEVAEREDGAVKIFYKDGNLKREFKRVNDLIEKDFLIHVSTPTVKWRILPKYVTFEEAMNALRKGRTVKYLGLRGVFSHIISPHEFETHGIGVTALKESGLRHMLDGKWQIIE